MLLRLRMRTRALVRIKNRIKRLHRRVNWLRMVDVVATNSTVRVLGVGHVQLGSFTVAVDTRRKMVDRARFFVQGRPSSSSRSHSSRRNHNNKNHHSNANNTNNSNSNSNSNSNNDQTPQRQGEEEGRQAEWILSLKSVLFTADGRESMEILDSASLNVHGFLYTALDGLRDAAVTLKLGRVHIPYDEIRHSLHRYRSIKRGADDLEPTVEKVPQEWDPSGRGSMGTTTTTSTTTTTTTTSSPDHDFMQKVADSKEFVSSTLRSRPSGPRAARPWC
ncbi:hypothetical protein VTK73DRAFT_6087 [Phialemonium thermophilum]|uniref:Uncharacterized protein n=1 Tax=Phialemonium thermophilum TaxID=223376 RepID=A0ABR3V089_9PEZI